MNKVKKRCENCKHFFQHYAWSANKYTAINCGHCLKNIKTTSPLTNCCANWEQKNTDIIKRKQITSIKQTLTEMAKKIDEIIVRLDFYENNK